MPPQSKHVAGAVSSRHDIAVVVISLRASTELANAVLSLVSQDVAPELLVVNSGGGDAQSLLQKHNLTVPVVSFDEVLFAGAARNVGIAATGAPVVAFLASDCLAGLGWTGARLARHRAGSPAVASALVNSNPDNLYACAAHVSNFARRLPGLPRKEALCYGASYARSLFDQYGWFREDLRTGEDTEFHARLAPADKPVWAPEVRTAHQNPTSFTALITDQFQRGRRAAGAYDMIGGPSLRTMIVNVYRSRLVHTGRIARCSSMADNPLLLTAARALSPITATAYVCGILAFAAKQRQMKTKAPISSGGT